MANPQEIRQFILRKFTDVEMEENFGYTFFFVGSDHRLPFATMADSDNDFDRVSNLDRPDVYRVNLGVEASTFDSMFGSGCSDPSGIDFSVLNEFLPHPDYAKQHFICILNPAGEKLECLKALLAEAHAIGARRNTGRAGGGD